MKIKSSDSRNGPTQLIKSFFFLLFDCLTSIFQKEWDASNQLQFGVRPMADSRFWSVCKFFSPFDVSQVSGFVDQHCLTFFFSSYDLRVQSASFIFFFFIWCEQFARLNGKWTRGTVHKIYEMIPPWPPVFSWTCKQLN